jgi:hypothetical protein
MQLAAEALLDVSRHIEANTDLPVLFGLTAEPASPSERALKALTSPAIEGRSLSR